MMTKWILYSSSHMDFTHKPCEMWMWSMRLWEQTKERERNDYSLRLFCGSSTPHAHGNSFISTQFWFLMDERYSRPLTRMLQSWKTTMPLPIFSVAGCPAQTYLKITFSTLTIPIVMIHDCTSLDLFGPFNCQLSEWPAHISQRQSLTYIDVMSWKNAPHNNKQMILINRLFADEDGDCAISRMPTYN